MERNMYIKSGKIDKDDIFATCQFSGDAVSFKKCIEAIINRVNEAEDAKDKALKQVAEWDKDKELEELREALTDLTLSVHNGFMISKEEMTVINEWTKKHELEKHGVTEDDEYCNNIYTYEFTPTSLGVIGTIECECGASFTFQNI